MRLQEQAARGKISAMYGRLDTASRPILCNV
jgi:hypothetical protein